MQLKKICRQPFFCDFLNFSEKEENHFYFTVAALQTLPKLCQPLQYDSESRLR